MMYSKKWEKFAYAALLAVSIILVVVAWWVYFAGDPQGASVLSIFAVLSLLAAYFYPRYVRYMRESIEITERRRRRKP